MLLYKAVVSSNLSILFVLLLGCFQISPADHPLRISEFKLSSFAMFSTAMPSHAHDHRRRSGLLTAARSEAAEAARVEPASIAEMLMDKLMKLLHSDIGKALVMGCLTLVGSRTKFAMATAMISWICQAILIADYSGMLKLTRSAFKTMKTIALVVMLLRIALQQDFLGRLASFTALCCALSWG